jgi:PAS domain S-box-containing protein
MMSSLQYSLDLPALDQVINRFPLTVSPEMFLDEVIALMSQSQGSHCSLSSPDSSFEANLPGHKRSSCVLVIADTQLVGIFTERSLVKLIASGANLTGVRVAEVMTRDLITLTLDDSQTALNAATLFRQHQIRHLPVLDPQGQLLGLITPHNIRQVLQPIYLFKLYRVAEVMTAEVIHALRTTPLLEITQLMANARVSCVVLVEPETGSADTPRIPLTPVGIITERDIVQFQALELNFAHTPAEVVMSAPLFTLCASDLLWAAHQKMQAHYVQRLVVMGDQGELLGIVTQTSLLQVLDPLEIVNIVETLHHQVDERTLELQQVNQRLEQELTERQKMQRTLRLQQQQLQAAQVTLEQRVTERTYKLGLAEEQLDLALTERKQTELKIREQAALLDIASDAIFVRDLEHQILYWNQGAERLYGWTAAEAIGQRVDVLLQEETSQLDQKMQTLLSQGEWRGELSKVTKAGKPLLVEGHWTLVRDEHGHPKSILSVNTDITEKKQLEAQFLRAQRLESIGILAGGIAHDLNNMLTPILVSAQLLQMQLPEEKTQELLKMMESSARRGADLVKQVLTFARGAEGKRISLQLKHLLAETRQVCQHTFPKTITITLDVPQNLAMVSGDPTQLQQVLMNLCVNARDAIPQGGELHLSAENFMADETYSRMNPMFQVGSYVVITVTDTGTGMAPEELEHIFDPFFTTKPVGKGTGLGLSVVQGIIHSHGGFIAVESRLGKGTQFRVYLPAISNTLATQLTPSLPLCPGQGELILVVDDESDLRQVTQSVLEANHYQVITASNGIEAIVLYTQHQDQIRVVIMDMMMPEMGGQTAIATLKQINPTVKVIASSGLALDQLDQSLSQTIRARLPKPYSSRELLTTLEQVLSAGNDS